MPFSQIEDANSHQTFKSRREEDVTAFEELLEKN
jgi:hypothetical protein